MKVRSKYAGIWCAVAVSSVGAAVGAATEQWRIFAIGVVILLVSIFAASIFGYRTSSTLLSRRNRDRSLADRNGARLKEVQEGVDLINDRLSTLETWWPLVQETATQTLIRQRELSDAIAAHERVLSDWLGGPGAGERSLVQRIDGLEQMVRDGDSTGSTKLDRLGNVVISEVDALLQLQRLARTADAVPLAGGWAMSPSGILQLVDLVARHGHRQILECGPGTSTVYLGRALQEVGAGRLVALEHLPDFVEITRSNVRRLGLDDVVEVRWAPLTEVVLEGETYRWYDTSAIDDISGIDLLVVDGPPGKLGPLARYPAFPLVAPKLADEATVFVDDTHRRDEQEVTRRWLSDRRLTPGWTMTRGQQILHWSSDPRTSPLEAPTDV